VTYGINADWPLGTIFPRSVQNSEFGIWDRLPSDPDDAAGIDGNDRRPVIDECHHGVNAGLVAHVSKTCNSRLGLSATSHVLILSDARLSFSQS
jgi:hypothetical protein